MKKDFIKKGFIENVQDLPVQIKLVTSAFVAIFAVADIIWDKITGNESGFKWDILGQIKKKWSNRKLSTI